MSKLRQAAEQEPVECMCGICKLGKREWVGLTDEEIANEFYKFEAADAWYQFARAIEAKLKEKNT
jgi:GH35 family endo-1,4-beta-xylanase